MLRVTVPHQSTPSASGSRDSRRRRMATGRQARATAASSTKMARQPNDSVSSPPSSGPTAKAAATVAPQMPMAPARAVPVKSWASRASEEDSSTAPASPWAARPAIRTSAEGASGAQHRRGREPGQPAQEHAPPPDQVGQGAGGQQGRRQGQRVAADHPLEHAQIGLEVAPDRGQGHTRRGHVQQQHPGGQADHQQGPALALPHPPARAGPASSSSKAELVHVAPPPALVRARRRG